MNYSRCGISNDRAVLLGDISGRVHPRCGVVVLLPSHNIS